ncbi:hypothetical protein LSAT2_009222 [Lamellibrachia satsuma]|nr:hypothetical protein LSAT2_009222 [Lamellibrachia satsuma]
MLNREQPNVQAPSMPSSPASVKAFLGSVGSINIVQSGKSSQYDNHGTPVSLNSSRNSYSSLDDSYHLNLLFHDSPDKCNMTDAQPAASTSAINTSISKSNLVVIDLTEEDSSYQVPTFYSGISHTSPKRPLDVIASASDKKLKVSSSGTLNNQQKVHASQNAAPETVSTTRACAPHATGSSQACAPHTTGSSQVCAPHATGSSEDCAPHATCSSQACAPHATGLSQACAPHATGSSQDVTNVKTAASSSEDDSFDTSSSEHDSTSTPNTPSYAGVVSPKATASTTQSTTSQPESTMTFAIYKCDFCAYMNRIWLVMNQHLENAQHFSASLYNAKFDNNNVQLVSIKHMVAIMNKHSKSKGMVVACPECRGVFEDIFMCSLHYKYSHDSSDGGYNDNGCGYYSICPVIQHETLALSRIPQCQKCLNMFATHGKLKRHWSTCANHHPLSAAPVGDHIFTLFNCPYCTKMFTDFLKCKSHTLTHKFGGDQQNGLFAIEVRHILQPKRREQVLPLDTANSNLEGIEAELSILKNMRKHMKNMGSPKAKKKKIRERMKYLRNIVQMYHNKKWSGGVEGNSKKM